MPTTCITPEPADEPEPSRGPAPGAVPSRPPTTRRGAWVPLAFAVAERVASHWAPEWAEAIGALGVVTDVALRSRRDGRAHG
ncbi:hypothetical protein AB0P15_37295 [Streptomyces sp. NPDC087917]|uniref:hypothetical protein n=1 Tax=Streptomyces sp. NPDC087917 TaxID=3155060 RepID=UPI00343518A7